MQVKIEEIDMDKWVVIRGHEEKRMKIHSVNNSTGIITCEHESEKRTKNLLSRHRFEDILRIYNNNT